ncbi:hypothetical protein AF72_10205 [Xylella taiwanensis]|uniref:Uncharacterized protein n=1 Tax=Xylella taiwanensis TaxID=1444770 RepID=Z9JIE3_9GAMM|nr:hypothetical protein AB672_02220 [Xylella taiwanensis]EWS77571.1 hypothetical protein AF72_10205 [Xylella taiwanensis]
MGCVVIDGYGLVSNWIGKGVMSVISLSEKHCIRDYMVVFLFDVFDQDSGQVRCRLVPMRAAWILDKRSSCR